MQKLESAHRLKVADPLSIVTGVVGITKDAKDAPRQARVILTELNDMTGILSHLQSFFLGNEFYDRSRTSLLKVVQVVMIVSSCVVTVSELEKLADDLKVEEKHILDCMKWAKEGT